MPNHRNERRGSTAEKPMTDQKQQEKTQILLRLRKFQVSFKFLLGLMALGTLVGYCINYISIVSYGPWVFFPGASPTMVFIGFFVLLCICSFGLCLCFYKIGRRYWEELIKRKRNWLTTYGVQVPATVTKQEEKESYDSEGATKINYLLQLTWSHPETEEARSFWEEPPQSGDVFATYPRGTPLSMQYDPDDPSFFFVEWKPVPRRRVLSDIANTTAGIFVGGSAAFLGGDVLWWPAARKRAAHAIFRGHSYPVAAVAWSPDGHHIASGSSDGTVQVWNAADGKRVYPVKGGNNSSGQQVTAVAWSPDGTHIASSLSGLSKSISRMYGLEPSPSIVQIWNASDGRNILIYQDHTDAINAVAWSPDGRWLASGSDDQTVQIWDASNGRRVSLYSTTGQSVVETLAWSPDSQKIAFGCLDGTIQVLNAADESVISTYPNADSSGTTMFISTVAWSPDGKYIASGGEDKTVQIWKVAGDDGNAVFTYAGHLSTVTTVAWSPDGKRIASGSDDKTVQVWNANGEGDILAVAYRGHTAPVETVAWSPDGRWIASGGNDKTVQVWNATNA